METYLLNFCTLFDSYYLDKGLALYYSLERVCPDFRLYIFAFDEASCRILKSLHLKNAEIISLQEFESKELLSVKKERTKAEYCWTCTPYSIEYVLDHYPVDACTYLDADLYFYSSPAILLNELKESGCSVMITEHRFENTKKGKKAADKNGKYCVQFNTFVNDENGRRVLSWWRDKCLEWCYFKHEKDRMGDQKYLDNWTRDFKGVHELKNQGGGLAPWNLYQYELLNLSNNKIFLRSKATGRKFNVIFYHFQNLRYLPGRRINIKAGRASKDLKYAVYIPYLKEIEKTRHMLRDKFQIEFKTGKSCSGNKIVAFIQSNIMQYKLGSITDILNLDKLERYSLNKKMVE